MAHPQGTKVRQVAPAIEGEVKKTRFNEMADCLEYLVGYTNDQGEAHERWFLESQVEVAA